MASPGTCFFGGAAAMAYLKSTYACQFPLGDIFVVTSYSSTVFFIY